MTTALDIIKRSLRMLGVYATGEAPSADECQDGLAALNAMLSSWANERLMMFGATLDAIPLTQGQATYTIGPSGSVVTARPQGISDASYIQRGELSLPLKVLTQAEYNDIGIKSQGLQIPSFIYYEPTFPNGTVTLWPVPTDGMTLNLWSFKALSSFPLLNTQLQLPPGYEDAIAFNLAVSIAPEYEVQPSAAVVARATGTKRVLKRTNTVVPVLGMPNAVLSWAGWGYGWIGGGSGPVDGAIITEGGGNIVIE